MCFSTDVAILPSPCFAPPPVLRPHTQLTINLSLPVSLKNLSTVALPPILSLSLRLQAAPTCSKSQGHYGDVFVMWSFLLLKTLTWFFNLNMSSPFLPLTQ